MSLNTSAFKITRKRKRNESPMLDYELDAEEEARKADLRNSPYYQEGLSFLDAGELVYNYVEQRQLWEEWVDNYCKYEVPTYASSGSMDVEEHQWSSEEVFSMDEE